MRVWTESVPHHFTSEHPLSASPRSLQVPLHVVSQVQLGVHFRVPDSLPTLQIPQVRVCGSVTPGVHAVQAGMPPRDVPPCDVPP